jgi:hypothetical protein
MGKFKDFSVNLILIGGLLMAAATFGHYTAKHAEQALASTPSPLIVIQENPKH